MIRAAARIALERLGLRDHVSHVKVLSTKRGRRGLRDDQQLAFFMAAVLSRNANCIDVGAHNGSVLRRMVELAPDGKHMAFEPIPALATRLANDFPTVSVHPYALSDEAGESTFHVAESPELSGLQQRDWLDTTYTNVRIDIRRLDDMVAAGRRVDFLKIDVEGAQVRVLLGARRVLVEHKPAIWVEHGARSAGAYGTATGDLWNLLNECGYRVWTADGEGPLDLTQMEASNDLPMWTYMAHR
jgi:FkbM family methyltransferase